VSPGVRDTIFGVRGVVTAIDSIAGAFGFYMQLQGGGPNSGIDVFTGGANYQSTLRGHPRAETSSTAICWPSTVESSSSMGSPR